MKHYLYNMLSNIKNAQQIKKPFVVHKRKKFCEAILTVLWEEGFINGYKIKDCETNKLIIFLKYSNDSRLPAIQFLKPVSKPGRRIYYSAKQLWKLPTIPMLIVSTNKGVKSLTNCKKLNLGGEPILFVK